MGRAELSVSSIVRSRLEPVTSFHADLCGLPSRHGHHPAHSLCHLALGHDQQVLDVSGPEQVAAAAQKQVKSSLRQLTASRRFHSKSMRAVSRSTAELHRCPSVRPTGQQVRHRHRHRHHSDRVRIHLQVAGERDAQTEKETETGSKTDVWSTSSTVLSPSMLLADCRGSSWLWTT